MLHKQMHKQSSDPPKTLEEVLRADEQAKQRAVWWLEYQLNKLNYQRKERSKNA